MNEKFLSQDLQGQVVVVTVVKMALVNPIYEFEIIHILQTLLERLERLCMFFGIFIFTESGANISKLVITF